MASGQPVVLPLAKEADLYSQRDGTPNIYWSDPKSWPISAGARLIRVRAHFFDLEDYGATTPAKVEVKLYAQESIDGKTWKFVRDASGNALDFFGPRRPVTGTTYASDPFFERAVMPPNGDFSPLVRYGLQIQHADYDTAVGQSQVYARVTCELEITTSEPFTVKSDGSRSTGVSDGTIQPVDTDWVEDVSNAASITAVVACDVSIATNSKAVLQYSVDGSNWFDVVGDAVSAPSADQPAAVTSAPQGTYVRAAYLFDGYTGGGSDTVTATLIVRGNQ